MKLVVACSLVIACGPSAVPEPTKPPPPPDPAAQRPATPKLHGPPPDVGTGAAVTLPTMPSFQLPPIEPGLHSPFELLVVGRKLLGTEVKVQGYITWIYDCLSDVGRPGEKVAAVQKRIDADPTLCERPKFYLGDAKDTPPERSMWVVDVPRKPNKLERERLPRDELASWPAVPRLAVGDLVVVTAQLARRSPHSESNSDGLLVYRAIAPGRPTPAGIAPATPGARPEVPPPVITKRAPTPTDAAHQTSSVVHSNAGTRAYGEKQLATAIAEYQQAVAAWPDNHIAYYGLAGTQVLNGDWTAARDAIGHAVALAPEEPTYHVMHGYILYEGAVQRAREDQARAQGVPPAEVDVDRSNLPLDDALVAVSHASRLNRDLWRAHYVAGRIYRDRGEARWAAEEFEAALRRAPRDPGPWIALAELDRDWRHPAAAAAVVQQGLTVLPDEPDLHYELAMALDDLHKLDDAIASYSRVIELRRDHAKAKFQRGQAYFRRKDYVKARLDLQDFLRAPAGGRFAVQQANKMLFDIAAKTVR